jgi:hypothetical protein
MTTMRGLVGISAAVLTASSYGAASAAPTRATWTASDKAAALQAAHHEANRIGKHADSTGWPKNVRTVSAVIRSGSVSGGSNTGHPCGRGKHAVITLAGKFPTIAVGGTPGSGNTEVRGVIATTKLGSRKVCHLEVQTGKVTPAADSVVLFRR